MIVCRSQYIVIMFLLACYTTACAPVVKHACTQFLSVFIWLKNVLLWGQSIYQHANTICLQILEINGKLERFINLEKSEEKLEFSKNTLKSGKFVFMGIYLYFCLASDTDLLLNGGI